MIIILLTIYVSAQITHFMEFLNCNFAIRKIAPNEIKGETLKSSKLKTQRIHTNFIEYNITKHLHMLISFTKCHAISHQT